MIRVIYIILINLSLFLIPEVKAEESSNCLSDIMNGLVPAEAMTLCIKEMEKESDRNYLLNKQKGFIDKPFRNLKTHPEAPFTAPYQLTMPSDLPQGSIAPGNYVKAPWSFNNFKHGSEVDPKYFSRRDEYIYKNKTSGNIISLYIVTRNLRKNVGRTNLTRYGSNFYLPQYRGTLEEFNCRDYTSRFKGVASFSHIDSPDDTGFWDGDRPNHPMQKRVKNIEGERYFVLPMDAINRYSWEGSPWSITSEYTWGRYKLEKACNL